MENQVFFVLILMSLMFSSISNVYMLKDKDAELELPRRIATKLNVVHSRLEVSKKSLTKLCDTQLARPNIFGMLLIELNYYIWPIWTIASCDIFPSHLIV